MRSRRARASGQRTRLLGHGHTPRLLSRSARVGLKRSEQARRVLCPHAGISPPSHCFNRAALALARRPAGSHSATETLSRLLDHPLDRLRSPRAELLQAQETATRSHLRGKLSQTPRRREPAAPHPRARTLRCPNLQRAQDLSGRGGGLPQPAPAFPHWLPSRSRNPRNIAGTRANCTSRSARSCGSRPRAAHLRLRVPSL